MTYDFILMNPPYNVGGKITKATLSSLTEDGICVCLMPLAQYKPKALELWRYVETFELADPEMFDDASITGNLCICCLKKKAVDKYSIDELIRHSFSDNIIAFIEKNSIAPKKVEFHYMPMLKNALHRNNDNTFIIFMRSADGRQHGKNGRDYEYNVLKTLNTIPTITDKAGARLSYHCLDLEGKAHKNFGTWWYCNNGDNLSVFLMKSLNKNGGSCESVIPQIDWETISDHPLWKQGDYDGAVLSVMNLRWNEDKIVAK